MCERERECVCVWGGGCFNVRADVAAYGWTRGSRERREMRVCTQKRLRERESGGGDPLPHHTGNQTCVSIAPGFFGPMLYQPS